LNYNSDQPFIYQDHDNVYIILVNGEIYNYNELIDYYDLTVDNNSDCAVIYPLFKKLLYDFKSLNNILNGEYSLAIIHLNNNIL